MAYKKIILSAFAIFFVVATSVWSWGINDPKFDSPDETMNYFFAARVARGDPLQAYDAAIAESANLIHPRSFNVINSALVPGGFLGHPVILGAIGRIVGVRFMFLLIPLLAAAAIFALAAIVRRVFDENTAWITAILAFTSPIFIYHAALPYFPNVFFASLLILGIAALMLRPRPAFAFAGGALLGLALFVRTSEALAVGALFAVILFIMIRNKQLRRPVVACFGFVLGLAPMFYLQLQLYGSIFSTGYARFQDTAGEVADRPLGIVSFFLPFGFQFANIAHNVLRSFFSVEWWIVIPMLVGFAIWIRRRPSVGATRYTIALFVGGAWLFIFYGSWLIGTPVIRAVNTISLSYVRYWLPVTLFALPFVAIFYQWLWKQWKPAAPIVFVLTTIMSFHLAFLGAPESLIPLSNRTDGYRRSASELSTNTPADAVIITVWTDKIAFPERRVVATWPPIAEDGKLLAVLPNLSRTYPLYFYARLSDDEKREADTAFTSVGFALHPKLTTDGGENLYELKEN